MQDCFRLHPEIYGDELANSEPPEDDEPVIAGAIDAAVEGITEDAPSTTVSISSSATSSIPSSPSKLESESRTRTPPPDTLTSPTPSDSNLHPVHTTNDDDSAKNARAEAATAQVKKDHETKGEEELVPKEWHDTRQKNDVQ